MTDRPVAFSNPSVNLYAHDIDRSIQFYRDILGFTETFRIPQQGRPDHVELRLGTLTVGVATFDALRRHHGIRSSPGPPRVELALFTADVDGAFGWSTDHGAAGRTPPKDFGGYIHRAVIADPDGNPVIFTTRLPLTTTARPSDRPTFRNHLFNIYTDDLDRSLGFYRDLVGFRETYRTPAQGPPEHVELELGPLNLSVSTLEALRRHHGLEGGGGPPRAEVVLWTNDVDAAHAWMQDRGVPTLSPPHDFAGTLRATWVADPDGNPVQIVTRRPPG